MTMLVAVIAWAVLASLLACFGWALWYYERQVRELAQQVARTGMLGEPEPARIAETPDAEERALEVTREAAIDRAARFISRERPGISDERARAEAEELISKGIGGGMAGPA